MKTPTAPDQADGGASPSDLEQGFTVETVKKDPNSREDSDGSTYTGNPYDRGGFADRPMGWQR